MIMERKRGFGPGTWALIALGGAALLMLAVWALGGPTVGPGPSPGYGPGGMMPWGWGMAGAFGALMPLMLLSVALFWIAVILGIVALVRSAAGPSSGQREDASDALEIARRRYARGEINREEYERLREDLQRGT